VSNESGNGKYLALPGKIPGVPVNLGGADYILAPLNLRQAEELEPVIKALGEATGGESLSSAIKRGLPIILASLQRNYPDMTEADLSELIDLGNFHACINAITSSSGYTRQGEPVAASR
jgi:hypothetical protein